MSVKRVRITQIDGALPNLALMKLSAWHKARGDEVVQTRAIEPDLFEDTAYDVVYGSAIFKFSDDRIRRFQRAWPDAILGGTGTGNPITVEQVTGEAPPAGLVVGGIVKPFVPAPAFHGLDYSGYPDFDASIGFTQRGCRLKCKFCVVPAKEGKNRSTDTIASIWRGDGHPKHLHLLDNDFFGQEAWRERIAEIREGGFKVCLSQGINVRLINEEAAAAIATIKYSNTKFSAKQLYTAWDNLKDEKVFFNGVDILERAGIPPTHLMAYMLIGFDKSETWERIWHRFNRMVDRGIHPYPMVFDKKRTDLVSFQRWVITRIYKHTPWDEYRRATRSRESTDAYVAVKQMEPA